MCIFASRKERIIEGGREGSRNKLSIRIRIIKTYSTIQYKGDYQPEKDSRCVRIAQSTQTDEATSRKKRSKPRPTCPDESPVRTSRDPRSSRRVICKHRRCRLSLCYGLESNLSRNLLKVCNPLSARLGWVFIPFPLLSFLRFYSFSLSPSPISLYDFFHSLSFSSTFPLGWSYE